MKKFLVGVANVVAMQGSQMVFSSKTMLNTGIEVSTSNTEIRGGQGNALQGMYYHTGTLSLTLEDTQFSLPLIALNTGAKMSIGADIWETESVTLVGLKGTLTKATPVAVDGQGKAYVYYDNNGTYLSFEATDKTFTATGVAENSTLCVTYLKKVTSKQITIPSNIIPERVRLYLTANLASDIDGKGFIGTATVEIPVAQLTGSQSISMTADGYSNTPLSATALAYSDNTSGCENGSYYAKITEHLYDTNWYDDVTALAIQDGDFNLAKSGEKQLLVWAIAGGRSFQAPIEDLTFTSGTTATATVSASGLVKATATGGTTDIKVVITKKNTIEAHATCTVA